MTYAMTLKRMLCGLGCAAICGASGCSASQVSIGESNQGVNSDATCPIEKCETQTAVAQLSDGGSSSYDPNACQYFTGIAAEGDEWWSDGDELGWSMRAPGAVAEPGVITNRTCAPSQFAGEGSMPDSACAWKYQCAPASTVGAGPHD